MTMLYEIQCSVVTFNVVKAHDTEVIKLCIVYLRCMYVGFF